jgi:hypothetical protein
MDDIGDSEERMAGRQHGFSPAMRCFHPLSFRPSTCHPLTPSSSQLTGVESILASHIVADYLRQHSAVIETRCPAIDTLQFRAKQLFLPTPLVGERKTPPLHNDLSLGP